MLLLSRERETQISSLFFFKMSLSFFLSFFSKVVPTLQVPSLSHLYQKDRKKSTPHKRKQKKKTHTQKHRPPHPKRIQSVVQSSSRGVREDKDDDDKERRPPRRNERKRDEFCERASPRNDDELLPRKKEREKSESAEGRLRGH